MELELPMNIQLVAGNPRIEDTHEKVVLMRGPMVYCVEETDNKGYFVDDNEANLLLTGLKAEYKDDLLGGVVTIRGKASKSSLKEEIEIMAIPYYSWCNREQGQMKVWLPAQME